MLLLFFSKKKKKKKKKRKKERKRERKRLLLLFTWCNCQITHSKVTKLVTHNIIFHSHVINSKITSDFMPIIIIDIIVLISPPQF